MNTSRPHLLIADDDPDDIDIIREACYAKYVEFTLKAVSNGEELLTYLENCSAEMLPAVILLDYKMPIFTAGQLLAKLNADARYASVIKMVWSSSDRRQYVDECLKEGALHYFIKPSSLSELAVILEQIDAVLRLN